MRESQETIFIDKYSMVKGLSSHSAVREHVTYTDSEILHVTKIRFSTSYEIYLMACQPIFFEI